jgi:hypothetical protein
MRPTVSEQLEGSARILEQSVGPGVATGHAGEMLRGIVKNLRMLGGSIDEVVPFLDRDSDRMEVLLADLGGGSAPQPQAAEVPADEQPLGFSRANARNQALRGRLVEVIRDLDLGVDSDVAAYDRIVDHLKGRVRRYPLRMAIAMPKART